ncbi:MAG: DUF4845 domain-containing protein [Rubrivivax sp.]|nr:MAG: DUF4845 domain-containing protein [Rubrivivax sp.]
MTSLNQPLKTPRATRRQRGITLFGLLFWAVLVGGAAVILMKLFPAINEYRTIQSMVTAVAREGASTVPEVRTAYERRRAVEYGVESVRGPDLEITKEDDKLVISFAYDKEIELVDPVYLLLKFKGHSR